jgi:hypothetical protein
MGHFSGRRAKVMGKEKERRGKVVLAQRRL